MIRREQFLSIFIVLTILAAAGVLIWFLLFAGRGVDLKPIGSNQPEKGTEGKQPKRQQKPDWRVPPADQDQQANGAEQSDPSVKGERDPKPEVIDQPQIELPVAPEGFVEPDAVVWGSVELPRGIPASRTKIFLLTKRGERWVETASVKASDGGIYGFGAIDLLKTLAPFAKDGPFYDGRALQPGEYRIEARLRGYKLASEDFTLAGTMRKDFMLEPRQDVAINFHVVNSDDSTPTFVWLNVLARDAGEGGEYATRFDPSSEERFVRQGNRVVPQQMNLREGEQALPAVKLNPISGRAGWFTATLPGLAQVEVIAYQSGFRIVEPSKDAIKLDLSSGQHPPIELRFERLEEHEERDYEVGESVIRGTVNVQGITLGSNKKVTVSAVGEDGFARRQVVTTYEGGSYEIPKLIDGDYLVRFHPAGLRNGVIERHVTVRGAATLDVNVTVSTLSFDVSSGGSDLTGITLSVSTRKQNASFRFIFNSAQSQGAHVTTYGEWAPGEYRVELDAPNATIRGADPDGVFRFRIPDNGTHVTQPIEVISAVDFRAQVISSDGYGWAGAEARLVPSALLQDLKGKARRGERINWDGTALMRADHLGVIKADDLPRGDYTLLIWGASSDPNTWDLEKPVALLNDVDLGGIRLE